MLPVLLLPFLLISFCLSLYGCVLWSLSSPDINIIQVALNHHHRRIWKLPRNSHSAICHCLSQVSAIRNVVLKRFSSFCKSALSSSSPLTVSRFFLIPVSFLIPLQAIIICMVISMSSYILIKMYHLQCIFVIFVSILALIHPLNLMFLISLHPDTAVLFPAF